MVLIGWLAQIRKLRAREVEVNTKINQSAIDADWRNIYFLRFPHLELSRDTSRSRVFVLGRQRRKIRIRRIEPPVDSNGSNQFTQRGNPQTISTADDADFADKTEMSDRHPRHPRNLRLNWFGKTCPVHKQF